MDIKLLIQPKKVLKILLPVNLAIVLLSLFFCSFQNILGHRFILLNLVVKIFSIDNELFIPAFYSSALLVSSSILFAIVAYTKHEKKQTFIAHWSFLSFIFLILAWDEAVSIHELFIGNPFYESLLKALGFSTANSGLFKFSWVILGMIAVIAFFFSYLKFFFHLPTYQKRMFLVVFSVYIGGALIMEMINGVIETLYTEESLPYIFSTSLEEFLEMTGVSFLIYTLLKIIEKDAHSLIVIFSSNPESTEN